MAIKAKTKSRIISLCMIPLCLFLFWQVNQLTIFKALELNSQDLRMVTSRLSHDLNKHTVILDIDEASLQQLGSWPWPRKFHGQAVEYLYQHGAKCVTFDILFPEPDRQNLGSDTEFAASIENKAICLAMMMHNTERTKNKLPADHWVRNWQIGSVPANSTLSQMQMDNLAAPIKEFLDKAQWVATLDVEADIDGVYRKRRPIRAINDHLYFGIDVVSAAMALGQRKDNIELKVGSHIRFKDVPSTKNPGTALTIPIDDKGETRLNYYAKPFSFSFLSYVKIMQLSRYDTKTISTATLSLLLKKDLIRHFKDVFSHNAINDYQDDIMNSFSSTLSSTLENNEIKHVMEAESITLIHDIFNGFSEQFSTLLVEEEIEQKKPIGKISTSKVTQILKKYFDTLLTEKIFPNEKNIPKAKQALLDQLKDKIILIGSSSRELHDQRISPYDPEAPGVEMVATAIENIITEDFLRFSSTTQNHIILILCAIAIGLITLFSSALASSITLASLLLMYNGLAFALYRYDDLMIPMFAPSLIMISIYTMVMIVQYIFESKDKAAIREQFGKFVSPALLNQVMEDPSKLKLGGELRDMSVSFSGLVGFTEKTHGMQAQAIIEMLQTSHTRMTETVLKYKGTLDKFEGDTVMAFWGAPIAFDDHGLKGCLTILDNFKVLKSLNADWQAADLPTFEMEAGLNTGTMVVGNIGSENKMDYSIIGDVVNTAARVRGANKIYGTDFVVTGGTYPSIKDHLVTRLMDNILFIGKLEPLPVYEVICRNEELTDELKSKLVDYEKGYQAYTQQQWDKAIKCFEQVLATYGPDGPCDTFIARCKEYQATPPESDWDGRYVMKTK